MSAIWFITGASRGIGLETARAALHAGESVVATARRKADVTRALGTHERLLALELDVTNRPSIDAAVTETHGRFGGIDVLVNNAGYGHMGMFEDTTDSEMRAQFETNVFGLMNVTRAVLPGMRKRRRGHIMNLSSVAGSVGFTSASLYCASKFAVEGFSFSLVGEVKDFGIHVTVVSPGFIRTDFLEPTSIKNSDSSVADYAEASAQIREQFASYNQQQPGDPARLAQALLSLAKQANPPLRFAAGSDAVQMMTARLDEARQELDAAKALSASVDGQWS